MFKYIMHICTHSPQKVPLGRWELTIDSSITCAFANHDNCGSSSSKDPREPLKHVTVANVNSQIHKYKKLLTP